MFKWGVIHPVAVRQAPQQSGQRRAEQRPSLPAPQPDEIVGVGTGPAVAQQQTAAAGNQQQFSVSHSSRSRSGNTLCSTTTIRIAVSSAPNSEKGKLWRSTAIWAR